MYFLFHRMNHLVVKILAWLVSSSPATCVHINGTYVCNHFCSPNNDTSCVCSSSLCPLSILVTHDIVDTLDRGYSRLSQQLTQPSCANPPHMIHPRSPLQNYQWGGNAGSGVRDLAHQQNCNKYTYTYLPIHSSPMFLFSHMLGHPWKWIHRDNFSS
jgi:hypothetical protein